MKDLLFIALQYITPQTLLSRVAGYVAQTKIPWIKNPIMQWFVKRYNVDMSIAAEPDLTQYAHFNDFFTRQLAPGQRPIDDDPNAIVCAADGCISQLGDIQHGRIFQAKGQDYSLVELLGGSEGLAEPFKGGSFATIYLSPRDYHRVHMPLTGSLQTMIHIPGDLFSVNDTTATHVPRLFSRNERVVAIFSTDVGPMAVILVGAMIVASIETVWAGLVTPDKRAIRTTHYDKTQEITLQKGAEMGRFKLGSTAIVLFAEDVAKWHDSLTAQSAVMMGQAMGTIANSDR